MTDEQRKAPELTPEKITEYVSLLAEICDGTPVIDSHVHATEVIYDRIRYRSTDEPVMSVEGPEKYQKPSIEPARLSVVPSRIDPRFKDRFVRMAIDRLYQFSGPQVLLDQMDTANVEKAILLPVAHKDSPISEQMDVVQACCAASDRLIPAYSVHDSVDDCDLVEHMRAARNEYGLRLIKVHTNFSGINIAQDAGFSRINNLIDACGELALPRVFHGGESPILGERPERSFGTIENLKELNWGATSAPVVIAHFGVYGPASESKRIPDRWVAAVRALLDKHSHIYLDTSGVAYPAVRRMMEVIEPNRLLFGSDAYYVPIYRQVAFVMHALFELGRDLGLMRDIASRNALSVFNLDA